LQVHYLFMGFSEIAWFYVKIYFFEKFTIRYIIEMKRWMFMPYIL
jgi:hypothetical protein